MRDAATADDAQQRCVELLIPLLSSEGAANDEAILCAIVILRVCEQLSGKLFQARLSIDYSLLTQGSK